MQGRLTSDRSLTCSITLSSLGSFYDHFGRPDFDKIESLLGDQQEVTVCGLSRVVLQATLTDSEERPVVRLVVDLLLLDRMWMPLEVF